MISSKTKPISVLIPENLHWDNILTNAVPSFYFELDKMKFLVGLILERLIWDRRAWVSNDYPYTPLRSDVLKKLIYNYEEYIIYLITAGIIEQSPNNYSSGRYSKSYRLTEDYRCKTRGEFIYDEKLIKKIQQVTEARNASALRSHSHLTQWFDGLEVDFKLAQKWANDNLSFELAIANGNETNRQKAYCSHANHIQSILNLARSTHHFIVDEKGHRFHSDLTNLKSELRNALTYRGRKLVSIDVKNSQLALLPVLFDYSFYVSKSKGSNRIVMEDLAPNVQLLVANNQQAILEIVSHLDTLIKRQVEINIENWDEFKTDYYTEKPCSPAPHQTTSEGTLPMCGKSRLVICAEKLSVLSVEEPEVRELISFVSKVSEGKFYEFMLEEVGKQKEYKKANREWMKAITFTVLFSDESTSNPLFRKRRSMFSDIFPNVFNVIRAVKESNHTTLALCLQNIESEIFLNRITRRISVERPELPIYTIHDSVCTTVGNEQYVLSIMKDEFLKATGLLPSFSLEYWCANNLMADLPETYW